MGILINIALALGASLSTALTVGIVGTTVLTGAAIALVGGAIARALAPRRNQEDIRRTLRFASTLPQKRFVYGRCRIPGTRIPGAVRGETQYMAYLLNSRPSEIGTFQFFIDGREVFYSGDPYDLTGGGAVATNEPFLDHLRFWIGRGDQTQCPSAFPAEAGADTDGTPWRITDAFQGTTVIFCAFRAGDADTRFERWPTPVPDVDVTADWSKVWDPRDVGQSLANPATWAYSSNAGLCALDLLTQCPFRSYAEEFLHLDQWRTLADVAVSKSYNISGVVLLDNGELEQLIQPLMAAQAAELVRFGGKVGVSPGDQKIIAGLIADQFGDLSYSGFGASTATQINVTYSLDARGNESASLAPYPIPGATPSISGKPNILSVDLGLVADAQQAQNLREIIARREVNQATLSITAGPEAIDYLPGSWVDIDFTDAFSAQFNGTYEVQSLSPVIEQQETGGFTVMWQMQLRIVPANLYEPAGVFEVIQAPARDYTLGGVAAPGAITTETGPAVDINTGSGFITRIKFTFAPSASTGVFKYTWQFREYDAGNGAEDNWQTGGDILPTTQDGLGNILGYVSGVDVTKAYDIRVRAIAAISASAYVVASNVGFGFELTAASGVAGGAAGEADFTFTTPDVSVFAGVRVYAGATGSAFSSASVIESLVVVASNTTTTITVTGIAAGEQDFWLTPVTDTGSEGPEVGPFTITIT